MMSLARVGLSVQDLISWNLEKRQELIDGFGEWLEYVVRGRIEAKGLETRVRTTLEQHWNWGRRDFKEDIVSYLWELLLLLFYTYILEIVK